MKFVSLSDLSAEEQQDIETAFKVAEHSYSKSGNKVGTVIACENGKRYQGATVGRSRVIGATCAERMAMDQIFFDGYSKPFVVVTVGFLPESSTDTLVYPCGVCRQMYQEYADPDLKFIMVSWDRSRVFIGTLGELLPGGQGYYFSAASSPTKEQAAVR
jgi:cytidine deaminase